MSKKKKTSIGGMAVYEGIMFTSKSANALAVRSADGEILFATSRKTKMSRVAKIPIVRGLYFLGKQLNDGFKMMSKSFDMSYDMLYIEAEEKQKAAEKLQREASSNTASKAATQAKSDTSSQVKNSVNKTGKTQDKESKAAAPIFAFGMVLGLLLAVGLFFVLPTFLASVFTKLFNFDLEGVYLTLFEGGIRIAIFILYLALTSFLKDIRNIFMYHGAEHKVLATYENNQPLTVENVKKNKRLHPRCGTAYMFLIMIVSILIFSMFASDGWEWYQRIGLRLVLIPVIAGLSYEILKLTARFDFFFYLFYPVVALGLLMQLITTKEPTDKIIEVAIASFNKVTELEKNPDYPLEDMPQFRITEFVRKEILASLSYLGEREAQSQTNILLDAFSKRDKKLIEKGVAEKAIAISAEMMQTKKPIQYILGETEIYGVKIKVTPDVLIPRLDTEILIDQAKKRIESFEKPDAKVLDLCTGSGVIAVVLAVELGNKAHVSASDISEGALKVAEQNAQENNVSINFVQSDMFKSITGKYDFIVSNPPYGMSCEISTLDDTVKLHEPALAIDGGGDGLDFYRIIAKEAKHFLNQNGALLVEVGINQARIVGRILEEGGFANIEIVKDFNNIERVLVARQE